MKTKIGVYLSLIVMIIAMGTAGRAESRPAKIEPEVYRQLTDNAEGRTYVIVLLKTPSPSATGESVSGVQASVLSALMPDEFQVVYRYKNFAALTGYINREGLEQMEINPDVVAVGSDGRGEAHLDDSVPFINADDAHILGYTGDGITVAVLDTGIDSDHTDLSDNIAAGWYHFLNQGADQDPGAEDNHGHGTKETGIITSKGTDRKSVV